MSAGDNTLTSLACDYSSSRDSTVRERIVIEAQPIVEHVARKIFRVMPKNKADLDDFVSEGNIGLLEAIEHFDGTRGVKFETYSPPRIRGHILDSLRSNSFVPRHVRTKVKAMQEFENNFYRENGKKPTYEEYHQAWNEAGFPSSFRRFYALMPSTKEWDSLNHPMEHNGQKTEVHLTLPAEVGDTPEHVVMEAFQYAFEKDLSAVPRKYQPAIRAIFMGHTMKDTAANLDDPVSESRVSQLATEYLRDPQFFQRTREYFGLPPNRPIRLHRDELDMLLAS